MKRFIRYTVLSVLLLSVLVVFASADDVLPFTDVADGAWYYDTVSEAYDMGLMKGTSDTTFAPGATMTRSEFVTLLSRLAGADTADFANEIAGFADGDTEAWYAGAMGWGVKRGLIMGFTDNTVRPTQTITRAELAVLIVRYLDYMGYTLPDTEGDGAFTDTDKIQDWCADAIDTCRRNGVFTGDENGRFNPANEASRAEGATIVLRLYKMVDTLLETEGVVIARSGEKSPFALLYNFGTSGNGADMELITDMISTEYDMSFVPKPYATSTVKSENLQFVVNVTKDPDIAEIYESLGENEFVMKIVRDGEYTKLLFAYSSCFARTYAVEYLLTEYVKDGVLSVPADFYIKESIVPEDYLIIDDSINTNVRDPFILCEDGVYYAYITGWRVYKNTSGNVDGDWVEVKNAVVEPDDCKANRWAPEVHKYNGSYYMFTTYTPTTTYNEFENTGCIILKSDSPEGPFKMITDGWITPKDWDSIDGTFYVDPDGQPWMVFSHMHTSLDGNGAFAAAKLSEDLTHFISEPIELFRAKDPDWINAGVADGCFMYTTTNGELLMLWSNNDSAGYCLAVSKSSNGKLDGEWTHDDPRLYSELYTGFDGGHGMIFTAADGQMYVAMHAPNNWGSTGSKLTLIPIIERNGVLVWDLNLDK